MRWFFWILLVGLVGCASTKAPVVPLSIPSSVPPATASVAREAPEPLILPMVEPSRNPIRTIESANQAALVEPTADMFMRSVAVFPWHDGDLYRIDTAVHRPTHVILAPGERILFLSQTDADRWQVEAVGQQDQWHVVIAPRAADIRTRVALVTTLGAYYLDLRVNKQTSLVAVRFRHPPKPQPVTMAAGRFGVGYGVSGPQTSWRPIFAWDDGRKLYVLFPETLPAGNAPVAAIINEAGDRQAVNYRSVGSDGRLLIIDRLGTLELRVGVGDALVMQVARTDEYQIVECPGSEACGFLLSWMPKETYARR